MARYFNNPVLSDIKINICSEIYHAHKAILGSKSEYYYIFFEGNFTAPDTLKIDNPHFLEILKHIYSMTPTITLENVEYIISEADILGLDKLKTNCLKFCTRNFSNGWPMVKLIVSYEKSLACFLPNEIYAHMKKDHSVIDYMATYSSKSLIIAFIEAHYRSPRVEYDDCEQYITQKFFLDYKDYSEWERAEMCMYIEEHIWEQIPKISPKPNKEEAKAFLSKYYPNMDVRIHKKYKERGYLRLLMTFKALKELDLLPDDARDFKVMHTSYYASYCHQATKLIGKWDERNSGLWV